MDQSRLDPEAEVPWGDDGAAPDEPLSREARLRLVMDRDFAFLGRVTRNLGVTDLHVDDVVQQAFVVFARRLDQVERGAERSFLVQTAVRLTANHRRARSRTREIAVDALPDLPDAAPSPEDAVDRRQARALLDEVLGSMELDLRTVLVLFEWEELTSSEIAELLGLPRGTVASRLRRAREDFHERVRRLAPGLRGEGGAK